MSGRLKEIRQRRLELQVKAAWQRAQLAVVTDDLQHSLAWIDRTIASVRRFVTSPMAIGTGVGALTLIGPGRLMRWGSRLAMLYGFYKRFSRRST